MERQLDIEVRDSVFDPDRSTSEKVQYRHDDPPLYRVFVYLHGHDLPYVESVTYHLHETFAQPVRRVRRTPSNPLCKLVLWTWGVFEIVAVVADKRGAEYTVRHQMTYDRDFAQLEPNRFEAVAPTSGSAPA